MAAIIVVDAYSFMTLPDLVLHLEDTEISIIWLHGTPDGKKIRLGSGY